jgi:4-hydroxybenzoate polyprenyltransferase
MTVLPPTEVIRPHRPPANLADYVAIARPDHWVKHVFILPGVALAQLLHPLPLVELLLPLAIGLASAAAIASANYVLNEWLDARFDAFHPTKSTRPAVRKKMSRIVVALEYLGLAAGGLTLAALVGRTFFLASVGFLFSGWIYNVQPLRTKERPYLDVLTEALNNPIRLTLGWAMVDAVRLPPSSLLLAYWMGGAFLMAVKRLAEFRTVSATAGEETLALYRRSFGFYTESSLLLSSFTYAQMAAFFVAVFLVKYRIEYVLSLPFLAALFVVYLRVGLKPQSSAQTPERLFRERSLITAVVLLILAFVILTVVEIPLLGRLSDPHYIELSP